MNQRTRAWLPALPLVLACHSARPEANPAASDTCSAPSGQLSPTASADGLQGEYRLHVAATAGPRSGTEVDGLLRLRPMDDSLRVPPPLLGIPDTTTRYVLAGSVELDPAAIGATPTGDLGSLSPLAPGVLVIERHPPRQDASAEILLRFGAEANRRGVVRFDGGYFVLIIRGIADRGFVGSWASGTVGPAAEGYFCAERTGR